MIKITKKYLMCKKPAGSQLDVPQGTMAEKVKIKELKSKTMSNAFENTFSAKCSMGSNKRINMIQSKERKKNF